MLACSDLLPVYHLGQSQLLTFWGTEEWSRKYRISLGIFWGAYYLPLPRRHPIISLIGAPIPGAAHLRLGILSAFPPGQPCHASMDCHAQYVRVLAGFRLQCIDQRENPFQALGCSALTNARTHA